MLRAFHLDVWYVCDEQVKSRIHVEGQGSLPKPFLKKEDKKLVLRESLITQSVPKCYFLLKQSCPKTKEQKQGNLFHLRLLTSPPGGFLLSLQQAGAPLNAGTGLLDSLQEAGLKPSDEAWADFPRARATSHFLQASRSTSYYLHLLKPIHCLDCEESVAAVYVRAKNVLLLRSVQLPGR